MRRFNALLAVVGFYAVAGPVQAAEYQFSAYGGVQEASSSRVSGSDDLGAPFSFTSDWQGRSGTTPPYWGLRAVRWSDSSDWGFALEFTHTKVYASGATLASSGFPHLEFTDGLNIFTVNAMRRFPMSGRITPYVGAGVGISVPHVEARTRVGGPYTFNYQLAGPAARILAGAELNLSEHWSVFSELNSTYSQNNTDLTGGGSLDTDIFTYAINVGISYRF